MVCAYLPSPGDKATAGGGGGSADKMNAWMPWCGMVINTTTLETRMDLSRYAGSYMNDTLTPDLAEHQGKSLQEKLLFFLKMKFHPLMFDEDINTVFGTGTNVYQIFRLCAMKFCW